MFKSFSKTKLLLKKPKNRMNADPDSGNSQSMAEMSTPSPSMLRRAKGMSDITSTSQSPLLESPKRPSTGQEVNSEPKRIKMEDARQEMRGKRICHIETPVHSKSSAAAGEITPVPMCTKFGRHTVSNVVRHLTETRLILQSGDSKTCCVLRDSWAHHANKNVKKGDVVNVIGTRMGAVEGEVIIDDDTGLLVVNPDRLISGTSVVATLFCQRKAVLNDIFRGLEGSNKSMFVGTLLHELFQESVKSRVGNLADIMTKFENIICRTTNLNNMITLNIGKDELMKEVEPFLPHVLYFIEHYILGNNMAAPPEAAFSKSLKASTPGVVQGSVWKGKVKNIVDIEENIWSPRLGLKGKVDLTVSVELPAGLAKTVPLELKTGRASGSAEHKGQVILYSMMMGERREDPELGLLLYLRNSSFQEVKVGIHEMRGLVQLRNEVVQHLSAKTIIEEVCGTQSYSQAELPAPIESRRICAGCPHLLMCSMYQKIKNDATLQGAHPMQELVPQAVGHLSQRHEEFFERWSLMMSLENERNVQDNKLKNLWCMTPMQREADGTAIACLTLKKNGGSNHGSHVYEFIRRSDENVSPFFQNGDNVTLSTDKDLALTQGVIIEVSNTKIIVALDREINILGDELVQEGVYHIDKSHYQGGGMNSMVNLAKLMSNNHAAQRLRALIVDKNKVTFLKGLSKEVIPTGRHILRSLNKIQQKAIFKTLMAEQYILLQGLPGTGKTTVIVALVRLLVAMKKTVLLTAYTHSALDNILLKVSEHGDFRLLRIGKKSRVHPNVRQFSVEDILQKKSAVELRQCYESYNVVATTCLSLSHPAISSRNFDYCVVDEAGQCPLLSAIGPLFHAKKFVLVGDPEQLPPVVQSDRARQLGLDESLFQHLTTNENTIRLNMQYRMNYEIMGLANKLVYKDQLLCGSQEGGKRCLKLSGNNQLGLMGRVLSPDMCDSIVFLDTGDLPTQDVSGGEGVIRNSVEAKIVTMIVSVLRSFPDISFGVMAPYRSQVDFLRTKLSLGPAFVNTVDQFQGRDCDVIVYSCTRSLESGSVGSKDILNDIRRLNVAITRAKIKLVFIGNRMVLEKKYRETFQKLCTILDPKVFYKLSSNDID